MLRRKRLAPIVTKDVATTFKISRLLYLHTDIVVSLQNSTISIFHSFICSHCAVQAVITTFIHKNLLSIYRLYWKISNEVLNDLIELCSDYLRLLRKSQYVLCSVTQKSFSRKKFWPSFWNSFLITQWTINAPRIRLNICRFGNFSCANQLTKWTTKKWTFQPEKANITWNLLMICKNSLIQ